jgi:hypothetical protein
MPRIFSEKFSDVINMQDSPFCSDENVTSARLTKPLPVLVKDCELVYMARPAFKLRNPGTKDGEQDFRGWVFVLRSAWYDHKAGKYFCPTFDYQMLDVKKERLDTDCFLTQFIAPTFQRGQELVKSFGVKFSIELPEDIWYY